ncbi:MAG: hypothetical protein IPM51_17005 [Sphingobacteriaceae bacterium]|nr:hypothetical protein [Sphingobacteriaceae bacterium]
MNGINFYYAQQSNYDINDPRNPNCPCHKYQKLADEEYKKLLAGAQSNSDSKNNAQRTNIQLQTQAQSSVSWRNPNSNRFKQIQDERGMSFTNINPEYLQSINPIFLPTHTHEKGISFSDSKFLTSKIYVKSGSKYHKSKFKSRHKRKKFLDKHKKFRKFLNVKGWDVWKEFKNVSKCYDWS